MKIFYSILFLVASCAFCNTAFGQDNAINDTILPIEVAADSLETTDSTSNLTFIVKITSNFHWRDYISDYAAIQPSVHYAFGESGLSMNYWSSFSLPYQTNRLIMCPYLTFDFSIKKKYKFTLGALHYINGITKETSASDTIYQEETNFSDFMLKFRIDKVFFNPSISTYFSTLGILYSSFTFDKEFKLWKKRKLGIYGSIGYMNDFDDKNIISDIKLGLNSPFEWKFGTMSLFVFPAYLPAQGTFHFQGGVDFTFK